MISCQSGFTVKMKNAEDLMLCLRIWFIFSLHQSPLSIPVKYSGESSFKETDYITGRQAMNLIRMTLPARQIQNPNGYAAEK